MAGIMLSTTLERKDALALARDVARDLGYAVTPSENSAFGAAKGNFPLSIVLGAFIAYCDFRVEVQEGKYDGEVDIILERNTPWWTGAIGISRVKSHLRELVDRIKDAIKEDGFKVTNEKEF